MKCRVYRIEAMGECECDSVGDALVQAEVGDIRFNQSMDCRFIAIPQDTKPPKKSHGLQTAKDIDNE